MLRSFLPRLRRCTLFCAAWLLAAAALAQDKPAAPEAPPPRTVEDIVKILEFYKPDPAVRAKAEATLKEEPPQTEDRAALFKFYYARGAAQRQVGDDAGAIVSLRKARDHMTPGASEALLMLADLAIAEYTSGNALNAIQFMKERGAQIPQNLQGMVVSHEGLSAQMNGSLGDFDSARRSLGVAQAVYSRISMGPMAQYYLNFWTASLERARAEVFMAEGKYVEAEAAYGKVLRELEADRPSQQLRLQRNMNTSTPQLWEAFRIVTLRRQGAAQMRLGRLGEAELTVRAALKGSIERAGRFTTDTAFSLQLFAFILLEQGRAAEGALMAQEALKSVEGSGAPSYATSMVTARKALGAALAANGKWDEALVAFDLMSQGLAHDPELARRLGGGDIDWAHALLKRNRAEDAKKMLDGMLARSTRNYGEDDLRTALVRAFHAVALERTGARAQALAEFAKAVPVLVEQARNNIAADSGSVRQVRRLAFVLETYIELLSKAKQAGLPTPGIDPVAESFRLADVARGSEVQRALSASAARATIADPALAALARKEQDSQRRINALSDILKSLLSAPPEQQLPSVIAAMQRDVETLTRERAGFKREIEQRFPEYAELVDPKPVAIAQAQRSLRPGETMVSIYLGEDASFVWAVPHTGAASFASSPLTMAEVGKTVERLRKALDPGASSIAEIPAFDIAGAAKLYEQLLKPVEAAWKGETPHHLLVVPHGPLGQLPFGLLPTAAAPLAAGALPFEEYKKVPWLIREATLTQLPSVTALATLRRTPPPKGERRMFLGIGDPLFSKEQADAAVRLAQAATGTTTRGLPLQLRSAPKTMGVSSAELALLPRLPDTADELNEIGKTLGADLAQDVLLQRFANEKTVKSMNLADRRIVHFATHGLVPGELNGLTEPALALTAPGVAGVDGDGLLTMDEILALKLNADWVVLSACNTASGEGAGSEAVSGLGRAFFYAGARALLVSNWPVDTIAARRLMTDLFKRYATGAPTAKADSLRQAMVDLLDSPGYLDPATQKPVFAYAHPLFWAPFVLVGD
jgi:CHAT domain-containing protein